MANGGRDSRRPTDLPRAQLIFYIVCVWTFVLMAAALAILTRGTARLFFAVSFLGFAVAVVPMTLGFVKAMRAKGSSNG